MQICNHTQEQATQCAMFIHFKGKYAVQHGDENYANTHERRLVG